MSMKNPLTPAGIKPATFLFVAQHLNHCATAVRIYLHTIISQIMLRIFTIINFMLPSREIVKSITLEVPHAVISQTLLSIFIVTHFVTFQKKM
jgi:hypothetical protein